MELYKIEKENNYIANSLNELHLFEVYSLYQIIRYFDFHEERLVAHNFSNDRVKSSISLNASVINEGHMKPFQHLEKLLTFHIKTENFVPFDRKLGNFQFGPKGTLKNPKTETFHLQLYREDMIRRLQYPSYFIYFKIPYKFLLNHLTTIICSTDLPKFFRVFKDVDCSDYGNIVHAFREGDKKYVKRELPGGSVRSLTGNTTQGGKAARFMWRADMFPKMLHSMAKFGYGYPAIHTGTRILFDGSHRLASAAVVEKDYPMLLELDASGYKPDKHFYVTTPPWFDKRHVVLRIQPDSDHIAGFFVTVQEGEKYFKYKDSPEFPPNTNFGVKRWDLLQKYLDKRAEVRGFDFIWEQ